MAGKQVRCDKPQIEKSDREGHRRSRREVEQAHGGHPEILGNLYTSTLVDVPMLVSMPPARIAKLTGMRVFEAG